ncbi:MAG: hypothetical protein K9L62_10340 [Vallitaleaceae bacterium]|nr:hypothetical protein [Vallitaleaceae bacterium]
MIYKVGDVLGKLEGCIIHKKPFSHIRFGDGGIKFIDSILNGNFEQMRIIIDKEGLPATNVVEIFELWGYYARRADFIDSPEVYFNDTFWHRIKKKGKPINEATKIKMLKWKDLYHNSEFDNDNYCNPESNYLMTIRLPGNKKNILDIMKGRRIALITAKPHVKANLKDYNVDIIEIVAHYQNQYKNSYHQVMDIIANEACNYDFWLVAAGELGRIYTGAIKENGGRAVDIGYIIEFWHNENLHPRLTSFLKRSVNNNLELVLTEEGKKYEKYI